MESNITLKDLELRDIDILTGVATVIDGVDYFRAKDMRRIIEMARESVYFREGLEFLVGPTPCPGCDGCTSCYAQQVLTLKGPKKK